jgi:hypothetical protein
MEFDDVLDGLHLFSGRWERCGRLRALRLGFGAEDGAQGEAEIEALGGVGREARQARVRHGAETGRGRREKGEEVAGVVVDDVGRLVLPGRLLAGGHFRLLWLAPGRSEDGPRSEL